jgi:hypothetical protein
VKWDTPEKAYSYFEGKWESGEINDEYAYRLAKLLGNLYSEKEQRSNDETRTND